MADTHYEQILMMLYDKVSGLTDKVFTNTRPLAYEQMDDFIVVRLVSEDPYADTHNMGYVQYHIYVRDRQGGIENVPKMGELVEGVKSLHPFNNAYASCNSKPTQLQSKSDGMGFHVTVIQFRLVIKL